MSDIIQFTIYYFFKSIEMTTFQARLLVTIIEFFLFIILWIVFIITPIKKMISKNNHYHLYDHRWRWNIILIVGILGPFLQFNIWSSFFVATLIVKFGTSLKFRIHPNKHINAIMEKSALLYCLSILTRRAYFPFAKKGIPFDKATDHDTEISSIGNDVIDTVALSSAFSTIKIAIIWAFITLPFKIYLYKSGYFYESVQGILAYILTSIGTSICVHFIIIVPAIIALANGMLFSLSYQSIESKKVVDAARRIVTNAKEIEAPAGLFLDRLSMIVIGSISIIVHLKFLFRI